MQPPGPTFWRLDYRSGWRGSRFFGEGVAPGERMTLHADPEGPLALNARDGSIGGLILPRFVALDSTLRVYLLTRKADGILRFDPAKKQFDPLPTLGQPRQEQDGQPPEKHRCASEPTAVGPLRQFHPRGEPPNEDPVSIAIVGNLLYVTDTGNDRFQVFDLDTLVLVHVWGPWNEKGQAVSARAQEGWRPMHITAANGRAYLLDGRFGRVYCHRPGGTRPRCIIDQPAAADRWRQVAVDRQGLIYLLRAGENDSGREGSAARLEVYDHNGKRVHQRLPGGRKAPVTITDAGEIRDRFPPPLIRTAHKHRFCVPAGLLRECDRAVTDPPPPNDPLSLCRPDADLAFDRSGRRTRIDPHEPLGPPRYRAKGTWFSNALDSQIHGCQWHRIELQGVELPPGSRIEVSTYTYTDPEPPSQAKIDGHVREELWETRYHSSGVMQPPPVTSAADRDPSGEQAARDSTREFLVQSRQGRYLWLKVELRGDGHCTPSLRSILVHYPRQTYVDHLPAVFRADDDNRWFLERFLSLFQTEWDKLDRQIDDMRRLFDPAAVPAGPFLDWLSSWLDLPREGGWNHEQRRQLLLAMVRRYEGDRTLMSLRGTRAGLRDYLRVYLHNLAGIPPDKQGDFPVIIEGFCERRYRMLGAQDSAALGGSAPLWSPSVVGRLQIGGHSRVGEAKLVSTGDPERDQFHEHAHRFRVYLPAPWIRTAADESTLRRALDAEKPAHTSYELCLVQPLLCIGRKSTLGVDTVIGDYPATPLASARPARDGDDERNRPPPSLPAGPRLGFDTLLAGTDTPSAIGRELRLGAETKLL